MLLYPVLAVVVLVVVFRGRQRLARVPPATTVGALADRPYDVAYLRGGAELAVVAALAALHRREAIGAVGNGVVVRRGGLDPSVDELERAVHEAVTELVRWRGLRVGGPVRAALDRIELRLARAGLLLDARRRRHSRLLGGAALAVGALYIGWLVGLSATGDFALFDEPTWLVPFLVDATIASTAMVLGVLMACLVVPQSVAGQAALSDLERGFRHLSPSVDPEVDGPDRAALAVAVFGPHALWTSDAGFAKAIRAPSPNEGSGGG